MSIQEKIAALANIYTRNERENGEAYAKRELRGMLNELSAQLLHELQATREKVSG